MKIGRLARRIGGWEALLRTLVVAIASGSIWSTAPSGALAQTVSAPQEDVAGLRARLQPTMAPPHRPMPKDVKALDQWLASHDDRRIAERLGSDTDATGIVLDMNWEQTRIFDGAGLTVVLAYVQTLWRVADALPAEDAKGFRDSAGVFSLYALNIVGLDGERCADASAPGNRFQQVIDQSRPMLLYLRGLPRGDRMTIGSLSLAMEAATSDVRSDDPTLCSGGLEQYNHDLAAKGAGTASALPSYTAAFRDPDVWRPGQDKLRQALPSELTRYLTTPEEEAPAYPATPSP